ncbi:Gfo/Idh/MocA family oxidoreductase [Chitinophaga oryzae]|uniref:Gfo/Idh/MocA family oxidoreductase n=1 Tax=Chitinophaga oryzae TaxID=2725414 RepID=A0AAE6ZPW0_9BACT|nr:Gfo/Idh/MocA family oxidoreductase [Chitinophaga oryzae]QJB35465.1 Gfo/Idh/MocA family oxidoreductase [Chitinophaga oryzae]QJB42008.1 Gfo/Idh/MocA family oxidoreductase [Chitinophaga oryzae]
MQDHYFSRRKFLYTGAVALSGAMLTSTLPVLGHAAAAPLKIGIIGTGNRGSGIAKLLQKISGMELIACCDVIPAHLQRGMSLAAKGAKAYTDYRQLLNDKKVEAVIIATPLSMHYPMAKDALDAGKHVYLEKTMTYDIPQAIQLAAQVRKSGLVLQVGHQYRYYELYHRVKEVIGQNWLGKVTHFECQYHRNSDWRNPVPDPSLERLVNWRMYREYSGGLVAELCGHQIDMVNYLLDAHPLRVVGMGGIDYWKDGRETWDNVRTVFEYPGGVKASVSSILSNAYKGYAIRVLGDRGTIEIQRDKAFVYSEGGKKELAVVDGVTGATKTDQAGEGAPLTFGVAGQPVPEPTTSALLAFAESIRKNIPPASSAETGKIAAIAVHMANKAIETGASQSWKPEYDAS